MRQRADRRGDDIRDRTRDDGPAPDVARAHPGYATAFANYMFCAMP